MAGGWRARPSEASQKSFELRQLCEAIEVIAIGVHLAIGAPRNLSSLGTSSKRGGIVGRLGT